MEIFSLIKGNLDYRIVLIRGSGGNFCSGGDIRDFAGIDLTKENSEIKKLKNDPVGQINRQFGTVLKIINESSQVVICVLEGAVLGGGFGLACVSDVVFSSKIISNVWCQRPQGLLAGAHL